jgi:hypothetical protein
MAGDSRLEDWEREKKPEGARTRLASLGRKKDGTLNAPDAGS